MEYTLTLRRQKCYKSFERMTDTESGVPSKPPQHIQLSIYIRNRSEPIDKCPNSTLGSHTVLNDRHQDQLAKCPNSTSCSKEKFAGCTAVYLLDLGPCQLVQMHLSVLLWEGGSWQSVPSRRETGRDPKTNDFGNSEERAPKPALESSSTQPSSSSGSSTWKTLWSQISREHSATLARKTITIGKWV